MLKKKFLIAYAIGAFLLLLGSGAYWMTSDGTGGGSVNDEPGVRSVARGAQLHELPEEQPSPAAPDSTAVVDAASPSPVPAAPVTASPAPRATAVKVPVPQEPVAATVDPSTSTTFGGGRYEGPSAPNPVPRAPTGNPGFEITCKPVVKLMLPEADSDGCSIVSVGGFSGTVALACLDAPAGLNCYTDSQITLAAGATEGFHLTMTNQAPHGIYTLRIVGTSGALSDTVPIEFHSIDGY